MGAGGGGGAKTSTEGGSTGGGVGGRDICVVEYDHMNKERYIPATFASTLAIRSMVYPAMLIKTRLQMQSCDSFYKGTLDAYVKIFRTEGLSGFYRGFWVSSLQVLPAGIYLATYETTRHELSRHGFDHRDVKSFVGGFVGSFVCQLTLVPVELIMQHMMLMGNTAHKKIDSQGKTTTVYKPHPLARYRMGPADHNRYMGPMRAVIRGMYRDTGVRAFYQGFWAAIFCHGPHNALFWVFYDHYAEAIASLLPDKTPRMVTLCFAAPLSGMTAAFITNPLDVVRARIQVDRTSLRESIAILWREEGIKLLSKGISARVVSLGTHCFFTFVSYDLIKRWCVLEEFKDRIRW